MKLTSLTFALLAALCLAASAQAPPEMERIDGGSYFPLYAGGAAQPVEVDRFYLSRFAVTNRDFLAFVRANPTWQRSRVKRIFAGAAYLAHWSGDLDLGPNAAPDHPVVNVSWFSARAYAAWMGMRLPTVEEWEFAAAAGVARRDGRSEPGFQESVLRQYTTRSQRSMQPVDATTRNFWGIHGMHGRVWEWVEDFNSNAVTGESRNNTDLDRGLYCGAAALATSDFKDYAAFARFALRSALEADFTLSNLGFRLAADAPAVIQAQMR